MLLVGGPGLILSLAENKQLVSSAFEIGLVLEGLDELGEVAMNVARIERGASKLDGDHSSGTANSSGIKGGEVSPEGAIRVVFEEHEALKDGVEEVEGRRIRLSSRGAVMVSLEPLEEGKVALLLLE